MIQFEGTRAVLLPAIVSCVFFGSGCSPAAVTQTVETFLGERLNPNWWMQC